MHVRIVRTGGFNGRAETVAAFDTDSLGPSGAKKVNRALADLSTAVAASEVELGADPLQYEVEAADGASSPKHLTVFDDGDPGSAPMEKLDQLVRLGGGSSLRG